MASEEGRGGQSTRSPTGLGGPGPWRESPGQVRGKDGVQ